MDQTALALTHRPLLDRIKPFSKSSDARLVSMINAVELVDRKNLRGDVVECGVWRGGNIMLARALSPQRTCWLYDTFEGMPAPGPHDRRRSDDAAGPSFKGKSACSRETVIEGFRTAGFWDDSKIRIVPGMVEDTLLIARNLPDRIAVLRLDTDWHDSTKIELEKLYPRVVPGGVLIVDDYGHWQGARKAVDDYFGNKRKLFWPIDYTAVMLVKPAQG